jgi:hypothetical protein
MIVAHQVIGSDAPLDIHPSSCSSPDHVSICTEQATKLRPKQHFVLLESMFFKFSRERATSICEGLNPIKNLIIDLNDVDSSVPATIRNAVRFEEEVGIAVQVSSEAHGGRVVAAEVGHVDTEGLEVCRTRKRHEGAVVEGSLVPARAEAYDLDRMKALLVAWADDREESMEGVGVVELEVLAVQDVDGFVVDLFADCEDVREKNVRFGFFVWNLAPLRFPTPRGTLHVSLSLSIIVILIMDDSSTDRSSVRFGFRRNPNAVHFGKRVLVDHVTKFGRQLHERERLLGFLSMLRLLLLRCLFRLFLRSVSEL